MITWEVLMIMAPAVRNPEIIGFESRSNKNPRRRVPMNRYKIATMADTCQATRCYSPRKGSLCCCLRKRLHAREITCMLCQSAVQGISSGQPGLEAASMMPATSNKAP